LRKRKLRKKRKSQLMRNKLKLRSSMGLMSLKLLRLSLTIMLLKHKMLQVNQAEKKLFSKKMPAKLDLKSFKQSRDSKVRSLRNI